VPGQSPPSHLIEVEQRLADLADLDSPLRAVRLGPDDREHQEHRRPDEIERSLFDDFRLRRTAVSGLFSEGMASSERQRGQGDGQHR
jgi:hypothetical protein